LSEKIKNKKNENSYVIILGTYKRNEKKMKIVVYNYFLIEYNEANIK